MFVTRADSVLEPRILTISIVLSLLAVDYPPNKLACHVSDDGCSPLTYYSLVEAFKFAKDWIPFCKRDNFQVRAPFRYFSADSAGAMNVLTRVSGSMTNAPFMLNVDCDMFGNQLLVKQEFFTHGMAGIQGPLYGGKGTFNRRKIIYGGSPFDAESEGLLDEKELLNMFGSTKDLIKSAALALSCMTGYPGNRSNSPGDVHRVADCNYEYATGWGTKVSRRKRF